MFVQMLIMTRGHPFYAQGDIKLLAVENKESLINCN